MEKVLLLLWLLLVWCGWVVAAAAQLAVKEARSGIPPEKRGGVSIFPGLPIMPLFFWGIAMLIDYFAPPLGSIGVAGLHALFGIVFCITIVRDRRRLKAISS